MRIILAISFALLFILPSCKHTETDETSQQQDQRLPTISKIKTKKLSFAIQYNKDLNFEFCKRDIVFLDMFDYSKEDVLKCKKMGAILYGYFSSQWEKWRKFDQHKFPEDSLGNDLDNWPGEKWVNTKSVKIREIMLERIIYAKNKGFDGIDVDNVDGYHFKTGFPYSKSDSADYVNFFINSAHKLDMKFSLKNAMDLIPIIQKADFYQNESCYKHKHQGRIECYLYDSVSSPVGIIRYKRRCPKNLYEKAYTILKKGLNHKDKICD